MKTCLTLFFCFLFLTRQGVDSVEEWGVVLVDLRDLLSVRIHRLIRRLAVISPQRPIELWISENSTVFSDINSLHPLMTIKYINLPLDHYLVCCERTRHGYISKAYALLETSFKTAFFFDSETWMCDGWEDTIDDMLLQYPDRKSVV